MSKKELFLGMAIGDGHITPKGSLHVSHSTIYQEYLYFKYNILVSNDVKCGKISINNSITGYSKNPRIKFVTSRTFFGKEMRDYLYPNGIKIIPDDLEITPLMWSFIYMDDGRQNKANHYNTMIGGEKKRVDVDPWVNRYTLYTDSFDSQSIKNMQSSLYSYGIQSSISYANKNRYPHIHISKKESKTKFKELIERYMEETMKYKLNLPTYIIRK